MTTYVQTTNSAGFLTSGVGGWTVTGVTAGNLLTVQIAYYNGFAQSPPTITDSNGTVLTAIAPTPLIPLGGGTGTGSAVYYVEAANFGSHTFNFTAGTASLVWFTITEWPITATGVLDKTASASTSNGTQTTQSSGTTGTTTFNDEIVLVAVSDGTSGAGVASIGVSAPTGYNTSLAVSQPTNGSPSPALEHNWVSISAAGAQSATWNWTDASAGQFSQGVIATFATAITNNNVLAWVVA